MYTSLAGHVRVQCKHHQQDMYMYTSPAGHVRVQCMHHQQDMYVVYNVCITSRTCTCMHHAPLTRLCKPHQLTVKHLHPQINYYHYWRRSTSNIACVYWTLSTLRPPSIIMSEMPAGSFSCLKSETCKRYMRSFAVLVSLQRSVLCCSSTCYALEACSTLSEP